MLAVYFGAVQVKRIRHTLAAALTGDLAGIVAAVGLVSLPAMMTGRFYRVFLPLSRQDIKSWS